MTKIKASQALAKVLVDWNIDHIYGITADSINNTVDGFYQERKQLKYIQARHEEVGALAAAADAVFSIDVGNNTEWAIRQLPLNQQQRFSMSGWYGTMGYKPAGRFSWAAELPGKAELDGLG